MPSTTTTTTTTTKKPNDGPCAACNKEGAVLQCVPCRDAGVNVFFCNRECQVKLWKTHKVVCKKKTCNGDSKKEQSGASKKDKQEGNKGPQYHTEGNVCTKCLKSDADIGSKLSVCSKCNAAYYCSRKCQVEDWPTHKSKCKQNCEFAKRIERSLDSRKINIHNLSQKWVPKAVAPISLAVYYALKRKGIEQQPPVKAVLVEVEFDYNAQTFVLAEVPRAVTIDNLHQEDKEKILEGWKSQKTRLSLTQCATISTKELGKIYKTTFHVAFEKSVLDDMDAAQIDMYRIRNDFAKVRLKADLFRGWKSIRRNNLQKQMEQMNLVQSFTVFVQNALQFFCKRSLQNTHRIIVNMQMGQEIGQISQILEYKVAPFAEFKKLKENADLFVTHVEDTESRPLQSTDMAIETLFVDNDKCFALEYTVFCGVNVIQNKTAKQCKKAADKHFRKLHGEVKDIPSDLLEKVSL
ncbi:hypothetical protein CTEN210_17832 [Chaetoceros tenuissimus]|uniref:MYND-type domain-containing protein n=1 Tax=Chaetoceros tenuissimus TaxID=426638 RepID=A0AAD3DDL5_9STRA|nr:hypothetical protein CTEN210_17832 [Chaetoceros tenuissimus]